MFYGRGVNHIITTHPRQATTALRIAYKYYGSGQRFRVIRFLLIQSVTIQGGNIHLLVTGISKTEMQSKSTIFHANETLATV